MGLTNTAIPSTNWAFAGGAFIRVYCGGVGAKINLVSFEFVHRRLVLEHNELAVILKSGLKPRRHLGQVRVTDVLAFLVDDTPTMGPTNEQAAFGDLREESIAITLLGKGLKLQDRSYSIPALTPGRSS